MALTLIIIRGSPASGKTTLAKSLLNAINGKIAFLSVDEFRWIMTAHLDRDDKDYAISFENFLFVLENYLKSDYTVIVEDAWVQKHNDKSTDIQKVMTLGQKFDAEIHNILLKGSWEVIKHINTLRPMVIPEFELQELYKKVYSQKVSEEIVIDIDNKTPDQILKEAVNILF